MWNRFNPALVKVRQLLADGVIGELQMLTASLGFRAEFDPQHRLFNPELGGGTLLDVGVYPISLASWLLGKPETVSSWAHMGPSGVDMRNGLSTLRINLELLAEEVFL